ncbi:MAG: bifunctional diaminohydroxyphosphoribosylaminopyrimidine deaminase/5-amino-6-(5-phosphoribosylamino)uracil reductase RibD [Phycisphaeraceae bacterium]|nr:bifunctional diaminohydroxyphosphoribosylaminopyrimidine deaminase/5-amino-6-(5-phosphoribosylamino)uracil reductase RibD [Phycisphaeraceae bacterium]
MPVDLDKAMLDLAGRLALLGFGRVEPNPMVGCVIARGDRVLGVGAHREFGGAHAERRALESARSQGHDVRGATAYVTLEPCAHTGKQPPCTDALLEAGIGEVVYAAADPNPQASGGAAVLQAGGVRTRLCGASVLATAVSAPFRQRVVEGRPWVIAKWAQTLDGRIATRAGDSRWISGEGSRRRVHALRGRVDAILTGMGTVMADDPALTVRRGKPRKRPVRVVLDADLEIPLDRQLVRTACETPTIVCCEANVATARIRADRRAAMEAMGVRVLGCPAGPGGLDLRATLGILYRDAGVSGVLVEGGAGLLGSMFEAGVVDTAVAYIAPLLLGDELARAVAVGRVAPALSAGVRLGLARVRRVGQDVELTYCRPPVAADSGVQNAS